MRFNASFFSIRGSFFKQFRPGIVRVERNYHVSFPVSAEHVKGVIALNVAVLVRQSTQQNKQYQTLSTGEK